MAEQAAAVQVGHAERPSADLQHRRTRPRRLGRPRCRGRPGPRRPRRRSSRYVTAKPVKGLRLGCGRCGGGPAVLPPAVRRRAAGPRSEPTASQPPVPHGFEPAPRLRVLSTGSRNPVRLPTAGPRYQRMARFHRRGKEARCSLLGSTITARRRVAEALSAARPHGEEAKVLAGGMSLIPLMKLRFAAPAHLVDVNRVDRARGHREADGWLRIGAMTRHHELETSELIAARLPDHRGRRAPRRRTHGPQPGHAGRLARARRPGRRLGRGHAGGRRGGRGARAPAANAMIPIDDFLVDTFTTSLRAERDRDRGSRPLAGRAIGGDLPQDGAQGGRLRHGGRRRPRRR